MKTENIQKVIVIGAGVLGSQIAMLASAAGQEVIIFDTKENAFDRSYSSLLPLFNKGVMIPVNTLEKCKSRISQKKALDDDLKDADLVIEAIPEKLELKKVIFQEIGRKVSSKTIIATNSSSIPVSQLEKSSGRPHQCLNIHFYQPIGGIKIVDVMGGTKTDPIFFEKSKKWVKSLGCVPIKVKKEVMGFCFNSIWRAIKKQCL
jgi:3-hydroxybutyryl-CoA dehydrogenase